MSDKETKTENRQPIQEGYQPLKKGYQPDKGNLDTSNPPQSGSGVPSKDSSSGGDKNSGKK